MDRRLAVILAADVVGYSRLMGEAEEETHHRLHSYLEKIKQVSAQHGGRVFGTFGDSVVVEFASPVELVRCAIELQALLNGLNASVPADRRMLVRIGINLGDVLVEDENLYGDGVNIAARLESLAAPGGIVISEEVFRQVNKKGRCPFPRISGKDSLRTSPTLFMSDSIGTATHSDAKKFSSGRARRKIRPVPYIPDWLGN